MPWWSKIRNSE